MNDKVCSISNCSGNRYITKGLCSKHYAKLRRYGDPLATPAGNYKHGMTHHPIYHVWVSMRQRCSNPKLLVYKYYGGRGIKVCERWQSSFKNFYEDMGERPSPKHSIDRIDPHKGYEPNNCRWATEIEQKANYRPHGKGVAYDAVNNRYRAYITRFGKRHDLGSFKGEAMALKVREQAERIYYVHAR